MVKNFCGVVEMASRMRGSNDCRIDISKFSEHEICAAVTIAKNDNLFEFFDSVKDIPMDRLYKLYAYIEAKEKADKAFEIYRESVEQYHASLAQLKA